MKRISDNTIGARSIFFLTKSFGVLLSIVLFVAVIYLLATKNGQTEDTRLFAVASRDITGQSIIAKDMITFAPFPVNHTPVNGISADHASQLIGKKPLIPVQRGDIFTPSMFGTTNANLSGGLANTIPQGLKLTYIKGDDVHVFPPDIQKDNRIDLVAVNQKEGNSIQLVASNVSVFDVTHTHENNEEIVNQVGILLTDQQALALAAKLTPDWKLNITVHPQVESKIADQSLERVASAESNLKPTPNEDEKKKNQ